MWRDYKENNNNVKHYFIRGMDEFDIPMFSLYYAQRYSLAAKSIKHSWISPHVSHRDSIKHFIVSDNCIIQAVLN